MTASSPPSMSSSTLTCISTLTPPNEGSSSQIILPPTPSTAWNLCWSSDGGYLACCHGSPNPLVQLWKLMPGVGSDDPSFALVATLGGVHERTVRCASFFPSQNSILACASFDGTVSIWERFQSSYEGGEEHWECTSQLEGHENEVKCVAWNEGGTLLASCGRDKSVWIWECFLGVGGESSQKEEDKEEDFECIAVLQGHSGDVKHVVFTASNGSWGDGDDILLSCSYDDTVRCWAEDAGDWYCAATFSCHASTVWCVNPSPGGSRILTASEDCSLGIWKCHTASERKQLFPNETVSQGTDGLWKCIGTIPNAHQNTIFHVHVASCQAGHGRIASCGADNTIRIFREVSAYAENATPDKPKFIMECMERLSEDVNCVRWHPDGNFLASSGDDGLVKVFRFTIA